MIWRVEDVKSSSSAQGIGLPSRRRYVLAIEAEGDGVGYPARIEEGDELVAGEVGLELGPKQVERLRSALRNLDAEADRGLVFLFLDLGRRRLRITCPRTRQEWRIGPRGGSW